VALRYEAEEAPKMAGAVYTFTKPTDVRGYSEANKKVRFFDWTSDTGDYAAGGVTKTVGRRGRGDVRLVGDEREVPALRIGRRELSPGGEGQ
jgi:hypothetical protein